MKRVGVYSGCFNPVHSGHISFALQAIELANLDEVCFLPERHRSNKQDVAHFGHRVAMLRQAIKPHRRLKLIESNEITFSVDKTLPKLQQRFRGSELVFLMGSDTFAQLAQWPNVSALLGNSELFIGVRSGDRDLIDGMIANLPSDPRALRVVDSFAANVSSTEIREALRRQQSVDGLLASVRRYSDRNWLYISLT